MGLDETKPDEGGLGGKEEVDEEPKPMEMVIRLMPDGKRNIAFPLLRDEIVSYGFLKMGEKILDEFYREQKKQLIQQAKPGALDFVRNRLKGGRR